MDNSQFRKLLEQGSGGAILYAKENDVSRFQDLILDACLHCYSIDPQMEGTRSSYMLELLSHVPDKTYYYDAVLNALERGREENYHIMQWFGFAADMAKNGDLRAKRIMYENYQPGPRHGESIGAIFVDMDGLDGLLFVAEKLGAVHIAKTAVIDSGWLLGNSIEKFGEQATLEALNTASEKSPAIAAYRDAAKAKLNDIDHDWRTRREQLFALGYDQLKPQLLGMSRSSIRQWGEHASAENFNRAAEGLVATQEVKDQLAHMAIFIGKAFPLDCQTLLALAASEDEKVAWVAVIVLGQIKHPSVREFALHLIESKAIARGGAIQLIVRNFQSGDHELVMGWFQAEQDRETLHTMNIGLRQLLDQHPNQSVEVQILQAIYNRGPCSFCRGCAIQRLLELNALTVDQRAECAYDANQEIQQMVAGVD